MKGYKQRWDEFDASADDDADAIRMATKRVARRSFMCGMSIAIRFLQESGESRAAEKLLAARDERWNKKSAEEAK